MKENQPRHEQINLPPETTSFRKRYDREIYKAEKKSRKKKIIYKAKKERNKI